MMKPLQWDCEFFDAILFGRYVMVLREGRMVGGGMVAEFRDQDVVVGRKRFPRDGTHAFYFAPPPQCEIPEN
ncbi:hypothetical protein [Paenibacillus ferrarius]|uniref:hypothetical protein n=1 Tax=Paenibacillus ferrarius TaxID=1469647 RepID=UPI003D2D22C8